MAKGIMAIAEVRKTASAPHFNCSAAIEMGTNTSSPSEINVLVDITPF
jgi:hypothetical protein